ncbi:DNA repair protein RecN [bacterium]|nr:DNA repair protein RecN [bacterium]
MGGGLKEAVSFAYFKMICELRIKNLAVVEDTVLKLNRGLNVLTGSTGAGKSIILTAVSLLSGDRARKTLIRKGAQNLFVEGTFKIQKNWPLKNILGMDSDDDLLLIRRQINANGNNRIWINGILSTNSTAKKITGMLFELHGQHKQQELLNPDSHIDYLDSRGDYDSLLINCEKKVKEFRNTYNELLKLKKEENRNREKKDFLEYQYNELIKLNLQTGLKDRLKKKIGKAKNIHKFMSALQKSKNLLENSNGSVIDNLEKIRKELQSISSIDDKWGKTASRIEELVSGLNEVRREIEYSFESDPFEPEDLESLQQEIALIQSAERKYDKNYDELIEYRDYLGTVLKSLKEGSDEIIENRTKIGKIKNELIPILEELSNQRVKTAAILDKDVTEELRQLGIEGALFITEINQMKIKSLYSEDYELNLPLKGWDSVEFMLRTNIGEDIQPLCDIVSGGELSRVTLVLRSLLVEKKSIPTLIFDEIDAGLGADIGDKVSDKMSDLSENYQLICITHLAQIAAGARQHIVIKKNVKEGRTISSAFQIEGKQRVNEIARLLGGEKKLSFELATELIKEKSARSSAG